MISSCFENDCAICSIVNLLDCGKNVYDKFLKVWLMNGSFDNKKGMKLVDLRDELIIWKSVIEEKEEYKNKFNFKLITINELKKNKDFYENKKRIILFSRKKEKKSNHYCYVDNNNLVYDSESGTIIEFEKYIENKTIMCIFVFEIDEYFLKTFQEKNESQK